MNARQGHDACAWTRGVSAWTAALGAAALLSGCNTLLWPRTQVWPRPMEITVDPLPPGVDSDTQPGLVEVMVYRHADPVQVRRPSSPTAFPLTFYRKRQRVQSGAWVHVGAGGRAELFWPSDGAKLLLFDDGVCRVGEPGRGEPDVRIELLTRAEISLAAGAVIELPGGSLLSGPPDGPAGPYLVQHIYEELIRVFNQSKAPAYLAFRDERIELAAGERIDLPLLGAGGAPIDLGGPPVQLAGAGLTARAYGLVGSLESPNGLRLRANGPGIVLSQGVALRLSPGEEVTFFDLGPAGSVPPRSEPEPDVFDDAESGDEAAATP